MAVNYNSIHVLITSNFIVSETIPNLFRVSVPPLSSPGTFLLLDAQHLLISEKEIGSALIAATILRLKCALEHVLGCSGLGFAPQAPTFLLSSFFGTPRRKHDKGIGFLDESGPARCVARKSSIHICDVWNLELYHNLLRGVIDTKCVKREFGETTSIKFQGGHWVGRFSNRNSEDREPGTASPGCNRLCCTSFIEVNKYVDFT